MACKCGKNKDCKCSELLYIMNPGCGWCKKADPVVEELVKDGYKITTLDIRNADGVYLVGWKFTKTNEKQNVI